MIKPTSVLTIVILASIFAVFDVPAKVVNPNLTTVSVQETKDITGMTPQERIDMISKNKGQFGSADAMRHMLILPNSLKAF
jgi:hypothetical protein